MVAPFTLMLAPELLAQYKPALLAETGNTLGNGVIEMVVLLSIFSEQVVTGLTAIAV